MPFALIGVTLARAETRPAVATSRTRSRTRSMDDRPLSMARLNSAKSRGADLRLTRIARISFAFNGNFCPTCLPLFQGPFLALVVRFAFTLYFQGNWPT